VKPTVKLLAGAGLALLVGLAVFKGSPYWSMAGMARALCAENDARLEEYIDGSRMNLLEVQALKHLGRLACPSKAEETKSRSKLGTAWSIYQRSEVEWLTKWTIQARYVDEDRDALASAMFERDGLHWRIVDISLGE